MLYAGAYLGEMPSSERKMEATWQWWVRPGLGLLPPALRSAFAARPGGHLPRALLPVWELPERAKALVQFLAMPCSSRVTLGKLPNLCGVELMISF